MQEENQVENNNNSRQQANMQKQKSFPSLPGEYMHYQSPFRLLYSTKSLFKVLFIEWKACLMCIMKIYCIQYPKLYSDSEFLALMLKKIFVENETTISEEQFFKNYNSTQKIYQSQCCWLCEQLMQKKYLNGLKATVIQLIQNNNYINYEKYKLNIKMPLIYTLKYYVTCMYLWHQFSIHFSQQEKEKQLNINEQTSMYKVTREELKLIQHVLKAPYDKLGPKCLNNPILETKVVSKWLISTQINTQTPLQSTIQELQDMLTINIQHDYHNFYVILQKQIQVQDNLMKLFHQRVGLEKKLKSKNQKLIQKPQKKLKIDLTQNNQQDNQQIDEPQNNQDPNKRSKNESFKCIANNVNKILYLKYDEITFILDRFKTDRDFFQLFKKLDNPEVLQQRERIIFVNSFKSVSRSIKLETKNICFSGKYCKYSRYLSQTPWVVNGIKLTESSLQEQIEDKILHLFYPNIPKEKIDTKFHSGGREDIDVRMLKGGRPFVLELVNPIFRLKDLSFQKIIEDSNLSIEIKKTILSSVENISNPKQKIMFVLEQIVNNSTELVQIKDFQQADESYISVELKKAEIEKIKHYVCFIVSEQELTQKDRQIIEAQQDLELDQKTPLRVLHRRTLMIRKKMIHKMYMHLVTKYSAVVQIWASAGTYIKEFVHGDLERTLPNFGSLIRKKVDILQLDVGSLKQGNWQKGDDLKMKMNVFDWKQ